MNNRDASRPAPGRERSTAIATLRRAGWASAVVLLLFISLAGALASLDWRGTLVAVAGLPWTVVVWLLVLSLANYVLRTIRWLLFTHAVGVQAPIAFNSIGYVAGFVGTVTPGKMGEALRIWLLHRHGGHATERTGAAFVADRLFDLLAVVGLALLCITWVLPHPTTIAGLALLFSLGVAVLLRPGLARLGVNVSHRMTRRRLPRIHVRLRRLLKQIDRFSNPRIAVPALLLSTGGWFAEGYALYLLLAALGSELGVIRSVFAFCFSVVSGALTFLPGGMIAAEAGLLGVLAWFGVPFAVALTATVVIRLTTLWFAVLLGLVAFVPALRMASASARRNASSAAARHRAQPGSGRR